MDLQTIDALGNSISKLGAVLSLTLSAVGSGLGAWAAGMAAVGSWKKCYLQNKAAPFLLAAFVGAPLSQTIYGMILMGNIVKAATLAANFPVLLGAGLLGGLAMGLSAWLQGKAGAAAADSLAETGQGFGNYLMVLGVIETVALFVMVFITQAIK